MKTHQQIETEFILKLASDNEQLKNQISKLELLVTNLNRDLVSAKLNTLIAHTQLSHSHVGAYHQSNPKFYDIT